VTHGDNRPLCGGEAWEHVGDRGSAAGDAQPFVDVSEVDADGSFRYVELVGDLGVGVPGSDQAPQFLLPGIEPGTGWRRRSASR